MAAESSCSVAVFSMVVLVLLGSFGSSSVLSYQDVLTPNDMVEMCLKDKDCASNLMCFTVDQLKTVFDANSLQSLNFEILSSTQNQHHSAPIPMIGLPPAKSRRDTTISKKLFDTISKDARQTRDTKLTNGIKAVEMAKEVLSERLKHMRHSIKRTELEGEMDTLRKLETELLQLDQDVEKLVLANPSSDKQGSNNKDSQPEETNDYNEDIESSEPADDEDYSDDDIGYQGDDDNSMNILTDYDDSDSAEEVDAGQSKSKDNEMSDWSSNYDYSDESSDGTEAYEYTEDGDYENDNDFTDRKKRLAHKPKHKMHPPPDSTESTSSSKDKLMDLVNALFGKEAKLEQKVANLELTIDSSNSEPPTPPITTSEPQTKPHTQTKHHHKHRSHKRTHPLNKDTMTNSLPDITNQHLPTQTSGTVDKIISALSAGGSTQFKVNSRQRRTSEDTSGLEVKVLAILSKGTSLSLGEAEHLKKEIQNLEHKENRIVDELEVAAENENNLDELEKRLVLVQLLQELESDLENKIATAKHHHKKKDKLAMTNPMKHHHRKGRSIAKVPHSVNKREAPWVNALMNQNDVPFVQVRMPVDNGASYHTRSGTTTVKPREKRASHHSHHHRSHHNNKGHKDIESSERRKNMDRCERCEMMVGEQVCGGNGKTYNSLCHAINCGGLKEDDVRVGHCNTEEVCDDVECDAGDCVLLTNGVCLTLYAPNTKLPCRQYMCVTEDQCISTDYSQVCGVDGMTYPSLCYLHKAGVQLAYSGVCRPLLCRGSVCGRDGVTYYSVCHARARGIRVDYHGDCFADSNFPQFHGCADVMRVGRCHKPVCSYPVLPKDSCCPVCGGAFVVHPDTRALRPLITTWKDINHIYIIENFLRKMLSPSATKTCELSATLTNAGNISVVLEVSKGMNYKICETSAKELTKAINGHIPAFKDNMLRPLTKTAALVGALNPLNQLQNFVTDTQNKVTDTARKTAIDTVEYADKQVSKAEQDMYEEVEPPNTGETVTAYWLIIVSAVCVATLASCDY